MALRSAAKSLAWWLNCAPIVQARPWVYLAVRMGVDAPISSRVGPPVSPPARHTARAAEIRYRVRRRDEGDDTSRRLGSQEDPPPGPVLSPGGGSGGSGPGGKWRQNMWVWPLPPAGRLTFICQWPAAGIPLTRHEIDAQIVLDAASRSQQFFTDEELFNTSAVVFTRGAE